MSKKTFRGFIAFLIVLIVAAMICACGYGSQVNGEWFKNGNVATWFNSWGKDRDDTEKDNISLASYSIASSDFAAYGISPQALEAKVITVDFEPVNTTNKRIGWSCHWKNAQSEWASGKNINDYVDFVPASNFGASATLAVKQPFGEPVVVTATSRANSALTSSSQFEYVARYSALWDENDFFMTSREDIYNIFDNLYISDSYTVLPTTLSANVTFKVNPLLVSYLREHSDSFDLNETVSFDNVTQGIKYTDLYGELNSFNEKLVAAFYLENDVSECDYYAFDISVRMICSYIDVTGNEVKYEFHDSRYIMFTDDFVTEISTPPTNITTNPGGGAF